MRPLADLLQDLESRGMVIVVISADRVEVRGQLANLTDELRGEIRAHKAALVSSPPRLKCLCTTEACCWTHRPGAQPVDRKPLPPDTEDERDRRVERLLEELRAAQCWLAKADARLGGDVYSDPDLATRMNVVIAEWAVRELFLRSYGFVGCIWQPDHCPTDAVEFCRACRSTADQRPGG